MSDVKIPISDLGFLDCTVFQFAIQCQINISNPRIQHVVWVYEVGQRRA